MTDAEKRAAVAERAARAGAEVARSAFRGDLTVERKTDRTDVVTEADREAQKRVLAEIRASFPDDPVVAEEDDARKTVPEDGPAWVVDPIDGTNNFVRGSSPWATSVAAVVDGAAVAAATAVPPTGDVYVAGDGPTRRNGDPVTVSDRSHLEAFVVVPTFWWAHDARDEYAAAAEAIVERFGDMRRFGSAQATLAMAAAGGAEGVVTNRRANPWDTVAGVHLVRRAGGEVTDLAGDPWRHDATGLVASNGTRHDAVLAAARAIEERTGDDAA
jgi:myo-inositol-1(or 4)-monophosphatase